MIASFFILNQQLFIRFISKNRIRKKIIYFVRQHTLYYSGDIDPEGIRIAERLLSRNNVNIVPWRFTKEDYEESVSGEVISQTRLKKLDGLIDPRLMKLGDEVRKIKFVGYQEMLMDEMEKDMGADTGTFQLSFS